MCWSQTATICFAILDIITLCTILYRRKPLWLVSFSCVGYFTGMEIFQFFQWTFGDVGTCSLQNRIFTYIAFVLVFSQMGFFATIGGYAQGWKDWTPEIIIYFSSVIVFTIQLIYHSEGILIPSIPLTRNTTEYLTWDRNAGNITCTVQGPYGHMIWYFATELIHPDFRPNFLIYLIPLFVVFLRYRWNLIAIPIAWGLSLIISIIALRGTIAELASFWCMLSVICSVFVWLEYSYDVFRYYYPKKEKRSKIKTTSILQNVEIE